MENLEHLVLPGGSSTLLINEHPDIEGHPMWSAKLLKTDPKAIYNVTCRYLEAGADVITTCTYQASVAGFIKHMNCNHKEAVRLIQDGVHIAKQAREDYLIDRRKLEVTGRNEIPFIAGSIGPYGAYLSDGSEYTGEYVKSLSVEELKEWHKPQIQALISIGVDAIGAETVPALKEALAIAEAMREFPNTKAWISFSARNGREISNGETLADVCTVLMKYPQIFGIGINCTSPLYVEPLLRSIGNFTGKKILVYPNSGEIWENKSWRSEDKVNSLHTYVPLWLSLGANWIGGCCRTTPEDIFQVRKAMDAQTKHSDKPEKQA